MLNNKDDRRITAFSDMNEPGFRSVQTLLSTRSQKDVERLTPLQIRNRLNKCGYHFHYKTRTTGVSTGMMLVRATVRSFSQPLIAWTAFYENYRGDYMFDHDMFHVSFFFEHEGNMFMSILEALKEMNKDY